MTDTIRIATRKSKLAVWQAEHVAAALRRLWSDLEVELVPLSTRGDRNQSTRLSEIGGKGLFIKELERALLDGEADIAVHSMKDLPAKVTEGMAFPAMMKRHNPLDAFVSNRYANLDALPEGARVGTASLRRQCQLLWHRPDLEIDLLRGNVQTRLRKLDDGQFDAIILAASGLERMGLDDRIAATVPPERHLPAISQGTIGIECLASRDDLIRRTAPLNHPRTWMRTLTERAFNATLQGSCSVPIGGYAECRGQQIRLRGMVGRPDGSAVVAGERIGHIATAEQLGRELGRDILERGGREILASLEDGVGP